MVHQRSHQLAHSILVGAQGPLLQTQQDVVLGGCVQRHHLVTAAGHAQSCKLETRRTMFRDTTSKLAAEWITLTLSPQETLDPDIHVDAM